MMNDTVREELETKIGRISGPLAKPKIEANSITVSDAVPGKPIQPPLIVAKPVVVKPDTPIAPPVGQTPPAMASRAFTGELGVKKTSPTLVDFQPKSQAIPDWRLQLQNSVRQRSSVNRAVALQPDLIADPAIGRSEQSTVNGSLAIKKEIAPAPATSTAMVGSNDRVANALKRIEASRKAHLPYEKRDAATAIAAPSPAKREHPFNVVSRNNSVPPITYPATQAVAETETRQKPRLVSSLRIEKRDYDTNKLPPLPQPVPFSTSFDINISNRKSGRLETPNIGHDESDDIDNETNLSANIQPQTEVIDDLAPFSLRLASGFFDIAVAAMASVIILSPIMANAATWFSLSGILLFTATLAIVLFLYLTASVSFWGHSFGMRLFSLELIDAEQNVYPSVHQSAVSSAVFLLSLATVGIGFITILFTEEKRAVHDIVSGTLIIRDI